MKIVGLAETKNQAQNALPKGSFGFGGNGGTVFNKNDNEFLTWVRRNNVSPEFFRNSAPSDYTYRYGAGILLKAADTYASLSVDYSTARVKIVAGNNSGNANSPVRELAFTDESYTKQESDGKYQIKGSYANAGIFTYYGGTESQIRSGNKNRYLYVNDDGRIGGYSANGMKNWSFDKEAILKLNRITLNNDCRIYDQSNGIFIETTNDKWLGVYNDGSVKCNSGILGFQNSAKKEPNGWWKCGDSGLIIQWGKWNNPYKTNDLGGHNGIPHGTNFTQNFAIPFSNACFNIMPNITNSDTRDVIYSPTITIHSFDKNLFTFQTNEHWGVVQNSSIYWLAIGY
ncbi:hypothetical protein KKJ04_06190 [Xenorhabdus bovienii]|uniref:gp53-like domain-containing protein n=1 Tax=Xenorhabdus bovienii TaxID=40576 RepID=UPI0023B351BA|nr:hypothetical protein [Xenorhabdus bovienii]MDE9445202.1 hypothetical protein [Xenorhabdus bovienii]